MDYAQIKDIKRVDEEIEKTRAMLTKFVLKTDFSEKFRKTETEIWESMATKMEKKVFDRKIESIEHDMDKERKKSAS